MPTVGAIVAAAGTGSRLGRGSKALVRLNGRTTLARVLELFLALDEIDKIVVVGPPSRLEFAQREVEALQPRKPVIVKAGGESRQESVRAGLAAIGDCDYVLVHDAARPLVSDAVVERLLAALNEGWDGAVPGLALADTVKRVKDEAIVETLPRDELVAVQTPQAFVASVLREAVGGGEATDCSALVEARGGRVKIVEGDPRLLKVTTAEDLALVESWLEGASE